MPRPHEFTGFPPGELIFRSQDEDLLERIGNIVLHLIDGKGQNLPPTTYENYQLKVVAPKDKDEKATSASWPMTREQFEGLWHPQISPTPVQTPGEEPEPETDVLDIFLPNESEDEEVDEVEDYLAKSREERRQQERGLLAARLEVAQAVLDSIPNDPFIQKYLDNHGVFKRKEGEFPPLGFNFEDIDRNLFYYTNEGQRAVFGKARGSSSSGGIDTISATYMSVVTGEEYKSNTDRTAWEQAIRTDVEYLVGLLRKAPQHYLDVFDREGYLFSNEMSGHARQVGTVATREFFRGYYQFAEEGVTLLKAESKANLFGDLDYKQTYGVSAIHSVYVALKHGIAGRPHLVSLQAVISDDPEEPMAEFRVYQFPYALDGLPLNQRIGGEYGDLRHDPEGSVARMGERMRATIPESTIQRILNKEHVGTKVTPFSHNDFYTIFAHLSKITSVTM